ncbi:MAG: hypothetical protein P4L03_08950 [Terracidiphilus sp.]|nr:hypothetical protein [Terracidiphilus sp.]
MEGSCHVYRVKLSQRILAILLLCVGVFFWVVSWGGALSGEREANFLELMFPVLFAGLSGYFVVRGYRNSVWLSDRTIEVRSVFNTKVLLLDKVAGRRRYLDRSGGHGPHYWHLVVESDDDGDAKLDFEEFYTFDDFFYRWFNALPDLDERDKTLKKKSNFGLV